MLKKSKYLLLVFSLIIFSCSTISVKTDFDRGQNFTAYKTYRWYDGKPVPGDKLATNQLLKNRVINSVNKVLKDRGFAEAGDVHVDFVVLIHAGIKEKMQLTNWGGYSWNDPWWGGYGGTTDVSYYEQATLVIDIFDQQKKELVWRGTGTGVVQEYSDPLDAQDRLDSVVLKILNDFPPGRVRD